MQNYRMKEKTWRCWRYDYLWPWNQGDVRLILYFCKWHWFWTLSIECAGNVFACIITFQACLNFMNYTTCLFRYRRSTGLVLYLVVEISWSAGSSKQKEFNIWGGGRTGLEEWSESSGTDQEPPWLTFGNSLLKASFWPKCNALWPLLEKQKDIAKQLIVHSRICIWDIWKIFNFILFCPPQKSPPVLKSSW